ncbi:hypothetical protein HRbin01_01857 [archaeon HR01]|nr:hypothetical protein HRbin01_01857 [archaeon HR01]
MLGLKRLRRSGWVDAGVHNPESVADHTFGVAFLSMLASDMDGFGTADALRIALLHDLAEAYTGDLRPYQKRKIGLSLVRRVEMAVVEWLLSDLPPRLRRRYLRLYRLYLEGKTREARLVHRMDKVELALEFWMLRDEGRIRPGAFRGVGRRPA